MIPRLPKIIRKEIFNSDFKKGIIKTSKLDIVLPCYNPANGWEKIVYQAFLDLRSQIGFSPGFILVNDGSNFNIKNDVNWLQSRIDSLRYIHFDVNRGKGYALRQGIKASEAPYIIYTDIDFPYKLYSTLNIIQKLQNSDTDIAIGIRDQSYYAKIPSRRKYISRIVRYLNKLVFNLPTSDTQCGLKGMNRKGREIFLSTDTNGYLIDLEFLKRVGKDRSMQTELVPVFLRDHIQLSEMNISILRAELKSFIKILSMK